MARPIRQAFSAGRAPDSLEPQTLGSSEHAPSSPVQEVPHSPAAETNDPQLPAGSFLTSRRDQMHHKTGDGAATPRDVLLALTYGLELVHYGAMLVAFEGRPQLAIRAAL